MKTRIFEVTEIDEIKQWIQQGKVIAFPTDTVFGLGVSYQDEVALQRLKQAKGRDERKPIPFMVSSFSQIEAVAVCDDRIKKVSNAFMPGALTLILKKKEHLPTYINNGLNTIAVRMPDDAFVLSLLATPMLVTSANISGMVPGEDEIAVLKQLEGKIDGIVKGKAKANIASTIVDMSGSEVTVVREGIISQAMIDAVLAKET